MMLSVGLAVQANSWSKFPTWAEDILNQVDLKTAPAKASVWTLYDALEFEMLPKGKMQIKRKYLRYVIRESGSEEGSIYLVFGDEDSTKVKSIKGWHQRKNGTFDKLDRKDVVTVGNSRSGELNRSTTTLAFFPDVARGSVVAFESTEVEDSFFPLRYFGVLGSDPVREMAISMVAGGPEGKPSIKAFGFENWDLDVTQSETSIVIKQIPAFKNEPYSPEYTDAFPYLQIAYQGSLSEHLTSWDALATWYVSMFRKATGITAAGQPAPNASAVKAAIEKVTSRISYRQRYLSPGRGWIPALAKEVRRRAYGDCKDMVSCLAFEAMEQNIAVLPVMANIGEGFRTGEQATPGPVFDHLIAAIKLASPMDLPAQVEVDGSHYLLVDPTSSHTPFGYLPSYYRNRDVMLCLESGARWIKIPNQALDKTELQLSLEGALDSQFTLQGTLRLLEKGNAFGLRTIYNEYNPLDLEAFLRRSLDLPGYLDMTLIEKGETKEGHIKLAFTLRWPSFLMRDAGGLRLPVAIVSEPLSDLSNQKNKRMLPIYREGIPKTTWTIQLQTETALLPGASKVGFDDPSLQFLWKAETNANQLTIRYVQESQDLYFSKAEIQAGLEKWNVLQKAFNPFALAGATLQVVR